MISRPTTPRWLLLTSPIISLVLSGCFGHCELSPSSARWTDRALYDALPDPASLSCTHSECQDAQVGLPLEDAALDARWEAWRLILVAWGPDEGGYSPQPLEARNGSVVAFYEDLEDFQTHRDRVSSFLANLSRTAQPPVEDLVDALAANATASERWSRNASDGTLKPLIEFRANLPAGWGPERAWRSLPGVAEQPSSIREVGNVQLDQGGWSFRFLVPNKQHNGDGFTLTADAEGRVLFDGLRMGSGQQDAYRERVRETLMGLSLPAPAPHEFQLGGSVC